MSWIHQIRVRYAETDSQGIAHHSSYVVWLEEARIEALRAVGHSYAALEASGVYLPVVELTVRYRQSLRFDELVTLETVATTIGRFQICFNTDMKVGATVMAQGQVKLAAVDRDNKLLAIPPALLAAFAP